MESDYSTDESSKRRRSGNGGEEDPFVKSRKIKRLPSKTEGEKLDKILYLMQDMREEMKDMKSVIGEINQEQKNLADQLKTMKRENEDLKKKYEDITIENKTMKIELKEIKDNLELLEKDKKKNNVVMVGRSIDTAEPKLLKEAMNKFMDQYLGLKIQVKEAHKLGEKICLIELNDGNDKEKIMKNKQKLKSIKEERIYINHDLTKKEREIRNLISDKAKIEKQNGKEVKVGYKKLTIDGEKWMWNRGTDTLERSKN